MTDPYSGSLSGSQETHILRDLEEEEEKPQKGKKGKKKPTDDRALDMLDLYEAGREVIESCGASLELDQGSPFCSHKVYVKNLLHNVKGIDTPKDFKPLHPIQDYRDLVKLKRQFTEALRMTGQPVDDILDFWSPFWFPVKGESEISLLSERLLALDADERKNNLHKVLKYNHTFDPGGDIGDPVLNPVTWVPNRSWFKEQLHGLKFEDIFTLFPPAETELLKLIIGRVGVGRHNHLPPGFTEPIKHTCRMAAVIVGKDPG